MLLKDYYNFSDQFKSWTKRKMPSNRKNHFIRKISDLHTYDKKWTELSDEEAMERTYELFEIVDDFYDDINTNIMNQLGGKFITCLNNVYKRKDLFGGREGKIDNLKKMYYNQK